ncbi:hypothetical protein [Endothiovibrio diazotrophicus]
MPGIDTPQGTGMIAHHREGANVDGGQLAQLGEPFLPHWRRMG